MIFKPALRNFTLTAARRAVASVAALMMFVALSVSQASAQAGSEKPLPPRIVVLGDSLVAGYQLPADKGFVPRLQSALNEAGVAAELIGAGVSGDTSSGGLARLAWSVPEGVDGVILELGANDALRGLPVAKTRENLEKMIQQLQKRGIRVLLVGMMAPPNMGKDYGKAFNAIYPALSEKYNLALYPFFLDGVAAQPELNLQDGIHPNEAGIDVIVRKILPTVEGFIEELRPAP